jgi:predicted phosphoribosyltransferase
VSPSESAREGGGTVFVDRTEAGLRLAEQLVSLGPWLDTVVLGIPRGGVVVAAEVARVLGLSLGVVATAKVSSPSSPEFAIGAVSADGKVYPNAASGRSAEEVEASAGVAREKVAHTAAELEAGREPTPVAGKAVLLVDDGLATGLTALAATDYLRRAGATLVVLAVPVASRQAVELLKPSVDRIVVVDVPVEFGSVGEFYERFGQTQDAEVIALLSEADKRTAS